MLSVVYSTRRAYFLIWVRGVVIVRDAERGFDSQWLTAEVATEAEDRTRLPFLSPLMTLVTIVQAP